jgi:hypothetical protein
MSPQQQLDEPSKRPEYSELTCARNWLCFGLANADMSKCCDHVSQVCLTNHAAGNVAQAHGMTVDVFTAFMRCVQSDAMVASRWSKRAFLSVGGTGAITLQHMGSHWQTTE